PNCRFRSPPGFERCPRCNAPLPKAGAVASDASIPRIGEYLMARGILGPREVQLAADRQRELANLGRRRRFGGVLVGVGVASPAQVEEAALKQGDEFESAWNE